jgi:hypothetical protein
VIVAGASGNRKICLGTNNIISVDVISEAARIAEASATLDVPTNLVIVLLGLGTNTLFKSSALKV